MYAFDFTAGDGTNKALLGGKGAGLATMTAIGLPVPPGFTLSTEACKRFVVDEHLPDDVWGETLMALRRLEATTGRKLGSTSGTPLLLSVRSGAKFSMPGMMDTVLDLGATEAVVPALAAWSGSEHFAWDATRPLVRPSAKVVLGAKETSFQAVLAERGGARGVPDASRLTTNDLREAPRRF